VLAHARHDSTVSREQRRGVISTSAGRDRGSACPGVHHRETHRRAVHGLRLLQSNADGRRSLYSVTRTRPSGRCAPTQGDGLYHKVGRRRGRDAFNDAGAKGKARIQGNREDEFKLTTMGIFAWDESPIGNAVLFSPSSFQGSMGTM